MGPAFGAGAVILTGITTNLWILGGTRWLEGASTAASVPSILGFIAIATMGDEGLRGKAVARFEAATLAGLGAGIVAAGPLWTLLHREAFFVNAVIYGISWAIYRFGVADPRADHGGHEHERRTSLARYLEILSGAHVWLLAPTWIAVNAAIGLWTSQSIFQLVKAPDPRFADQRLMAGVSPLARERRAGRRDARLPRRSRLLGEPVQEGCGGPRSSSTGWEAEPCSSRRPWRSTTARTCRWP